MAALLISVTSLLVSSLALWITYRIYRLSRADVNLLENIKTMLAIEERLQDAPSLLRFHGIDETALTEIGITPKEFAYLLNSFTAGRLGYLDGGLSDSGTFKMGSYRHTMLSNPHVRKAWPLLRPLIAPSAYRDAIDKTVKDLDESANQKPVPPIPG